GGVAGRARRPRPDGRGGDGRPGRRPRPGGGGRRGPARRAPRGALPRLPPGPAGRRRPGRGGRPGPARGRRRGGGRGRAAGARRVAVDGRALRAAVAAAPRRTVRPEPDGAELEVAVLEQGPDGVRVTDGEGIAVNREFLLEALDAGGDGQLLLSLDGPIAPLAITGRRSVSVLMPVRRQRLRAAAGRRARRPVPPAGASRRSRQVGRAE